jgi:hypothetical protein
MPNSTVGSVTSDTSSPPGWRKVVVPRCVGHEIGLALASGRRVISHLAFGPRLRCFRRVPEATAALRLALKGVADTYAAVNTAVDAFLTPPASRALNLPHYRSLATGRLKTEIEANRAHCTHLAQAYIESGGLRDTLPSSIEPAILDELDSIFFELGTADEDLFAAMIAVGDGLETESCVHSSAI